MPSVKLKTHKGIKKRFKVTATGKVGHKPCGSSHLNSHKSGSKIRSLRKTKYLKVEADSARLRRALVVRKRRGKTVLVEGKPGEAEAGKV